MNRFWILGPCLVLPWTWMACSSDTTNDGGTDSGNPTDSSAGDSNSKDSSVMDSSNNMDSSDMDTGGGMDAGPDVYMLNGCTDQSFIDKTDGGRSTQWDLGQSFPMCFTISAGQSFQWNANPNFNQQGGHPLEPAGGAMNNPILGMNSGTTVTYQFPNTGDFGFHCMNHPGFMQGAIRVK